MYTSGVARAHRERFVNVLVNITNIANRSDPLPACLVTTLRADFVEAATSYRPLADALDRGLEVIGSMTDGELRSAIIEPARARGITFDEGVVATILKDVRSEPGHLPLLEFALTRMWDHRNHGRLTLAAYETVSSVEEALSQHAEAAFARLSADEQAQSPLIFGRMTRLGTGTEDTRRVTRRDELPRDAWPLVQKLAGEDYRLVVTNRIEGDEDIAEVVHEALIRGWQRRRIWIDDNRSFLSWHGTLRVFLDQNLELTGSALAQAEEWLAKRRHDLTEHERAVVTAAIQDRDRAAREEAERQKRELDLARALAAEQETLAVTLKMRAEEAEAASKSRQVLAMGLFVVVLIAAAAAGFGWWQAGVVTQEAKRADEQTRMALANESRALALASWEAVERKDPLTAIGLALSALPNDV